MENITLGQITAFLTFIVGILGTTKVLFSELKKWFKQTLNEEIHPIREELKNSRIDNLKNFIVMCFDNLDKGEDLSEITKERLLESLDIYFNDLKQNSYIHSRYEKIKKEGKL